MADERSAFDDADLGGLDFVEALGRAFEGALKRAWEGDRQAAGAAQRGPKPPEAQAYDDYIGPRDGTGKGKPGAPSPQAIPSVGSEGKPPGLMDLVGGARGVAGAAGGLMGGMGGPFAQIDQLLAKFEQVIGLVEKVGNLVDLFEKFMAPDVKPGPEMPVATVFPQPRPQVQPVPPAPQTRLHHPRTTQLHAPPSPEMVSGGHPTVLGAPAPSMPGWHETASEWHETTGGKTNLMPPSERMEANAPPSGFDPFSAPTSGAKQGPDMDFWADMMGEGADLVPPPSAVGMAGEWTGGSSTPFVEGGMGGGDGEGNIVGALEKIAGVLEALEGGGGGQSQGGREAGVPAFSMSENKFGGMLPGPQTGQMPGASGEDATREMMLNVAGRMLGHVLSAGTMVAAGS